MLLHISFRLFVHRKDPVLAAGFDGHICDGETVIHGKVLYTVTGKLH